MPCVPSVENGLLVCSLGASINFVINVLSRPGIQAGSTAPTCSASCIAEYPVPIPVVCNEPFGIAKGFDDQIWFGDQNTIDTITRDGTYSKWVAAC